MLDLKKTDERIRLAARFISRYDSSGVLVVASRTYASNASKTFCKATGCKPLSGRFVPGILTNPARPDFTEPKLLVISDPKGERQAIRESAKSGIPVIALCDTDNIMRFIDLVIPCNNKGKKSLALIFYLLAREILKARGTITSDEEFKVSLQEFEEEVLIEEGEAKAEPVESAEPEEPPAEAGKTAEAEEASKKKERKKKETPAKTEEAEKKEASK